MDELVAHPGNILPRDADILGFRLLRNPLRRLSDNFDLPDDSVLNEGIVQKRRFAYALNVRLRSCNGVPDVFEINRIVTLRRQADVPLEFGLGGRD